MSSALALWVATQIPCVLRIKDENVANGHAGAGYERDPDVIELAEIVKM
jgi:hypothetical protein